MKVLIRTDASTALGAGHAVRTHTLAMELRSAGAEVCFVCRRAKGDRVEALRAEGFNVHAIGEDLPPLTHPGWSAAAPPAYQLHDAHQTRQQVTGGRWDWLIVDHYHLALPWESAMRGLTERLMVIDDLANRPHDCDLLLDQNYDGAVARYRKLVPPHCRFLIGPSYALLKPAYHEARQRMDARDGQLKRVLVFFGGSDLWNITILALEALGGSDLRHLELDIVLGSRSPQRERVSQLCASRGGAFLHYDLPDLAAIMARCDAAIGSVGTTAWERICLGLPTVAVTVAENEEPLAGYLDRKGLIKWCGRAPGIDVHTLASGMQQLAGADLKDWSERCLKACDGLGVKRVFHEMHIAARGSQ